jgi:hypothetical protein
VSDANPDEETVWVRHQWNGKVQAQYPLSALSELHWTDTCVGEIDGLARRSPHLMVHCYVFCNESTAGGLAHTCGDGDPPHRIKVCVVAKDNPKALMNRLKAAATSNRRRQR